MEAKYQEKGGTTKSKIAENFNILVTGGYPEDEVIFIMEGPALEFTRSLYKKFVTGVCDPDDTKERRQFIRKMHKLLAKSGKTLHVFSLEEFNEWVALNY